MTSTRHINRLLRLDAFDSASMVMNVWTRHATAGWVGSFCFSRDAERRTQRRPLRNFFTGFGFVFQFEPGHSVRQSDCCDGGRKEMQPMVTS